MTLPARVPFAGEYVPGSEITLTVCQGIGDIIWVWQKFYHYVDTLHFQILSVTDGEVCRRAMPWLRMLPKVGRVSFWVDHPHRYRDLAARPSVMQEVWDQWRGGAKEVEYACNKWLEEGVRLDEIDPGAKIVDRLEWTGREYELPYREFLVVYASGDSRHVQLQRDSQHHVWTVAQWVEYVKLFREKYRLDLPVVVIGAKFDVAVTEPLRCALKAEGIEATAMIGEEPEKVCHLLSRAKCLLAYQSGLNVVAELLGTTQVMLWFPVLRRMRNTFVRPENINTTHFSATFDRTPQQVIEAHEIF